MYATVAEPAVSRRVEPPVISSEKPGFEYSLNVALAATAISDRNRASFAFATFIAHIIGVPVDEPSPPEGEDVRFATLVRLASLLRVETMVNALLAEASLPYKSAALAVMV
jgi:hypothetical protein